MATPDYLGSFETLAEIAVGLAGFSGVAAVLRNTRSERERELVSFLMSNLIGTSLSALAFSLLPSGLILCGVGNFTTLRLASGLLAAINALGALGTVTRAKRAGNVATELAPPGSMLMLNGFSVFVSVALFYNAVPFFGEPLPGIYFFGVCWQLGLTALMFLGLTRWRPIEE